MDLRKSSIYLLVLLVCINAWCTMLYHVDIEGPAVNPGWNETAWSENLDVNATLETYTWDVAYSDFVFATIQALRIVYGLVLGAPTLFSSLGVPNFIVNTLYGAWLFIWALVFLLYYIGGREV